MKLIPLHVCLHGSFTTPPNQLLAAAGYNTHLSSIQLLQLYQLLIKQAYYFLYSQARSRLPIYRLEGVIHDRLNSLLIPKNLEKQSKTQITLTSTPPQTQL